MTINTEILEEIQKLSDKKNKTRLQEEKLRDLREFLLKNKKDDLRKKYVPKETMKEELKKNAGQFDKKKDDRLNNIEIIPTPTGEPLKGKRRVLPDLAKAKGGMVKKYMGGGSVHKNKKNMITTRGWGASRKT
jgi:hypothetical protein